MSIPDNKEVLLSVEDLCMYFQAENGKRVKASERVSFNIGKGEIYGLVGESGSGKSTIGKCIIGLNRPTSGTIRFMGEKRKAGEYTKDIQMIFQDPMSSLNPKMKVEDIVGEALDIRHICSTKTDRHNRVIEELKRVGIPAELSDRYPSQFSGGQRQRVGIARAMILRPSLVIADECIAALDACVQAQVINMLKRFQKENGMSILFISHDLSVVKYISDRIGVLHLGYLLETGSSEEIFAEPFHPYTRNLLSSIPRLNPLLWERSRGKYGLYETGVNYANGSWHDISSTHRVWCTDSEFEEWRPEH